MKVKTPSVKSETERFVELINDSMLNGFNSADLRVELIDNQANGLHFKSSIDQIVITRKSPNSDNESYHALALVGSDAGVRLGRSIAKYLNDNPTARFELSIALHSLTPVKINSFLPILQKRLEGLNRGLREIKRTKGKHDLLHVVTASKVMCKPIVEKGLHVIEVITKDPNNDFEYRILIILDSESDYFSPVEFSKVGTHLANKGLIDEIVALEPATQKELLGNIAICALFELTNTFNTDIKHNINKSFAEFASQDYQTIAKYLTEMDNLFEQTEDEDTFLKVVELSIEEQSLLALEHDIIYPEILNSYQADKKLK
ncbi:hypothetical protein [Pseudomonas syringae group genomosp. 3]|uniref:hypothetical protein n=1 Tax=Pseudomonas syringae group genomosp. 3 TaxID=251701 RepID=UPI000F064EC1|nr:hypothetical protein [Pseudomonas syringae group genomosp. 3]